MNQESSQNSGGGFGGTGLPVDPGESLSLSVHDSTRLEWSTARAFGPRDELVVLLGGDAGLRRGELLALEWSDFDVKRNTLHVQWAVWQGHVTPPKSGRSRRLPLTERLARALKAYRHPPQSSRAVPRRRDRAREGCVRASNGTRNETGRAPGVEGPPPPASHVLLPSRHARRASEGDPGARGARQPQYHSPVHAPVAVGP